MTREIPLTRGLVTIVDDEDYELFGHLKWYAQQRKKTGIFYAARTEQRGGKPTLLYLHREILGLRPGERGDHRFGNTLDNRRSQLRRSTPSQNARNQGPRTYRSLPKGVAGVGRSGGSIRFQAQIKVDGKCVHLGIWDTPELAGRAYDVAAAHLFGPFARLNYPAHDHGFSPRNLEGAQP